MAIYRQGLRVRAPGETHGRLRPPAVPLITHDPYFSCWSMADRLTDESPQHWTGTRRGMCGLVQIDGKAYRFLGDEPRGVPAIDQVGLDVYPTRTVYHFATAEVVIDVTFLSPLLPTDLDLLSRPVTYLSFSVRSRDGALHSVSLYLDVAQEWVVNSSDQAVRWQTERPGDLVVLSSGSDEQPVLRKSGDDLRIDWGYLYLAAPSEEGTYPGFCEPGLARRAFAAGSRPPTSAAGGSPCPAASAPALFCILDLGGIWKRSVNRRLLLAYDDLFCIEYLGRKLRPYWRGHLEDAQALLTAADDEYVGIARRCEAFDSELMNDLTRVGGASYAHMAALAYRQCLAAHKLACGPGGAPMLFSKENFSNGCIATVDVSYPSSPFFLLFNPELLRAQLLPVLQYAASPRWLFTFAPHDLGTYPRANGQVYGGGERSEVDQMPVEECGNMLIMAAAATYADGNVQLAREYYPLLSNWAEYLLEHGLDPENQLCTDDFAGHLARNTNLSLKSIVAIGAFAWLAEQVDESSDASRYRFAAESMAEAWVEKAGDGDHYALAFDNPGTWSQKYNLIWDRVMDLNLFPREVYRTEVAYYRRQLNVFGLPLDSRNSYTKIDWSVWTASLAENSQDFMALINPVTHFVNESPTRVPLTDWYWTIDGGLAGLMRARSVVGGIFMPMVADATAWEKWRGRGRRALARMEVERAAVYATVGA